MGACDVVELTVRLQLRGRQTRPCISIVGLISKNKFAGKLKRTKHTTVGGQFNQIRPQTSNLADFQAISQPVSLAL